MLVRCQFRIESEGQLSPWSRANIGLGRKNGSAFLVVTGFQSQYKYEVAKIAKIHSSCITFRDPQRRLLLHDFDKQKMESLMVQCCTLRAGKGIDSLPTVEEVSNVKPRSLVFRGTGDHFSKAGLENPELQRVILTKVKKIPDRLWTITDLTELNLTECLLEEVPTQLSSCCANLKILDLSHNCIKSLNTLVIIKLTQLTSLNLSHNKLSHLPLQIGALRNLVTLNASRNNLIGLPYTLSYLFQLKDLSLADNSIKYFNQLFLALFSSRVKLSRLDLSGNDLSTFHGNIQYSDMRFKFPDLFSLAASKVISNSKLMRKLPLYLPTAIEDIIHLRAEICHRCKHPFLRYNRMPMAPIEYSLNNLAAEVITNHLRISNWSVCFKLKCYYCLASSAEFALYKLESN